MNDITEIRDTAYGGYGVGTIPDGRVIFIPHTVKGDRVKYCITEDKSKFVYGSVLEIVEPSPLRGESYCPHIGVCGGCVFGHIDYKHQLEIKKGFLLSALAKNGISHPEPEVLSADIKEFRNRATFRVRNGQIGFFQFKTNGFVPVQDCPVIKKGIVEKALGIAPHLAETSIYITENEKGEAIASAECDVDGLYGFAGIKHDRGELGAKHIAFDTAYGTFYAGHSTFLQGNRYLSGALQDFVYKHASGTRGLELYCGAGFLTLAFSKVCDKVDAAETYAPSIKFARMAGMKNVSWNTVQSERMIMNAGRYDVIVTDPPRSGMDKSVCSFIKKSGAEKVVCISCDPNTLARDISRLSDRYKVTALQIADMFPGSYHLETMVLLNKV